MVQEGPSPEHCSPVLVHTNEYVVYQRLLAIFYTIWIHKEVEDA